MSLHIEKLKLASDNKDIRLMNVSRDTIYKRRQKIKDKLQINEPDTLETRLYIL